MVRTFIAIDLAPEVTERMRGPQGALAGCRARLSVVKPGSIHITLKFLGETPAELLPAIEAALAGVAAASAPIDLGLSGGGVFPPAGPPRVVWLGVTPEPALVELASRVEQALRPLGFPAEGRPFRPHLTLGRAEPGAVFDRALLARELRAPQARADKLALVRSQLQPGGAVYTNAGEWRFGG